MTAPAQFHAITAVWGDWHRRAFLDIGLPSCLAEGNLPALGGPQKLTYTIVTTPDDATEIRSHPLLTRLETYAEVSFRLLDTIEGGNVFVAQHRMRREHTKAAQNAGAIVLTIQPDAVFSDGAIAYLAAVFSKGYKAAYVRSIRVCAESFVPDLLHLCGGHTETVIGLGRQTLMEAAFAHAHPLMFAQMADHEPFSTFADVIGWPVYAEGRLEGWLLVPPFPADVLFFRPDDTLSLNDHQVITDAGNGDDIFAIEDSSNFLMVSLTPTYQYSDWYLGQGGFDPVRVARTSLDNGTALGPWAMAKRFVFNRGRPTARAWARVGRRASITMHRVSALQEWIRLQRSAQSMGCIRASRLMAAAIHARRQPISAGRNRAVTVFLPDDRSLSVRPFDSMALDAANGRLHGIFARHAIPGRFAIGDLRGGVRKVRSVAGVEVEIDGRGDRILVDGHPIIRGDTSAGPHLVHAIRGVIDGAAGR